jgi:hypothetical protein
MEEKLHPVPPVSGYRQLSQAEVDAMNTVKAAFNAVGDALTNLAAFVPPPPSYPGEPEVSGLAIDGRCVENARTFAQTAAMWANRAITRPGGFA